MNKNILPLAMMLAAGAAHAQLQKGNLAVNGTVVPGPCAINLAGGGRVDFGDMSVAEARQLPVTNKIAYTPAPKDVALEVLCDQAIQVVLGMTDNRASSKATIDTNVLYHYGIGTYKNANIGAYSLSMDRLLVSTNLQTSRRPSYLVRPFASIGTWTRVVGTAATYLRPNYSTGFDLQLGLNKQPLAVKEIRGPIAVQPYLVQSVVDGATSQIILDGSATITLQYF